MNAQLDSVVNCTSCGDAILDAYMMKVDGKFWHSTCLRCADCGEELEDRCFFRDNKFFCGEDYSRRKHCSKCGQRISATELIYKTQIQDETVIYHLACFVCCICSIKLTTGREYILFDDGRITCSNQNCKKLAAGEDESFVEKDEVAELNLMRQTSHLTAEVTNEKEILFLKNNSDFEWLNSNNLDDMSVSDSIEFSLSENNMANHDASSEQKGAPSEIYDEGKSPAAECGTSKVRSKRRGPRTTIKPHQLEALKEAFLLSQKPAKNVRESLAKKTGLEMRVIQVWFQNRRSKERRVNQANKSNRNPNFFDGNIQHKLRNHDNYPYLKPNFRDLQPSTQFYSSSITPSSSYLPCHFESFQPRPSWIYHASENFHQNNLEKQCVVTGTPVMSQCSYTSLDEQLNSKLCSQSRSMGRDHQHTPNSPCINPSGGSMTFDPYHCNFVKTETGSIWGQI